MKKLIAIFILCFLTGVATVNAAYQRHQKQPNFFMPAGAVKSTVNKPNFTVRQPQSQQLNNAKKAVQPTAENKKTVPADEPEKMQEKISEQPQTQAEAKTAAAPKTDKTAAAPAAQVKQPEPSETASALPQTIIQPLVSANGQDDEYGQSFKEYAEDLELIAQNEPVYNNRLNKNISDFKNKEHTVTVSVK